ncbi:cell division regulator GpsB [Bacillaceae bacterium S4-13-58]
MVERIQLNGSEILDKEFKVGIRGYNQEEVDQFLDVVIQDYEVFQQEIERLKQENEKLKRIADQSTRRSSAAAPQGQVNYDVLKRLSNLEKAVFGHKFSD